MTPKVLVIVPARGGSKRLPGKNLRNLAGKSLLAHTADAIIEAGLDAPVLLTTEADNIAAEGERLGWQVPFRRPVSLAADDSPTIDAVLHALDWFANDAGGDPEQVLLLQPTSPLRGGQCLRAALDLLNARENADAVIGVMAVNIPPAHLYLVAHDGFAEPVADNKRQPVYIPNGAVYLARTIALRASRSFYVPRFLPLVMDPVNSIDIDTETEWVLAEAIFAARQTANSHTPARLRGASLDNHQ